MTKLLLPPAPARKLFRTPWRRVELVSLDFEATGLGKGDTIISFGTVPIVAGGIEMGGSVYQLVDPGNVTPSAQSVVVHHLRPLDLVGAPSIEVARASLRAAIEGRFVVAWWAPVEAAFLDRIFGGGSHAWLHRMIDVRDLVLAMEGHEASHLTLEEAADRFGVPVASPHHALDDALVTAQLFLVAAAKLERGARSIRDMKRLRPPTLRSSDRVARGAR
jgi:DNA polymerase-3 subunit epsilon